MNQIQHNRAINANGNISITIHIFFAFSLVVLLLFKSISYVPLGSFQQRKSKLLARLEGWERQSVENGIWCWVKLLMSKCCQ